MFLLLIGMVAAVNGDGTFECTVTSIADTNKEGTLRWCINEANTKTNRAFIAFAVGDAKTQATIKVLTVLPSISVPMTIDGGAITVTGSDGQMHSSVGVIIDGAALKANDDDGLRLIANDIEILGLAIVEFPNNGVYVTGKRAKIQGEFKENGYGGEDWKGDEGSGVRLEVSASDAVIGSSGGGRSMTATSPTVIGGNYYNQITCDAPRK